MTCQKCQHGTAKKFGTYGKEKTQRYRCKDCGATFAEARRHPMGAHTTDFHMVVRIVQLLTEGMSLRAISRVTGVHKTTLGRLLLTLGEKAQRLIDAKVRNLRPKYVQADELWGYVGKKQKRLTLADPEEFGDTYTWLALDSDTKAILSFHVGKRDGASALMFMRDLSERVTGEFQLSTDAFEVYPNAIEEYFGGDVAYGQVVKVYSKPQTEGRDWYRPARVLAAVPKVVFGEPDEARISTSHVERLNLSLRMHTRRLTRLTNAFSKSLRHMRAAISLFVAVYNFCRQHGSTRVSPMMDSGVTDHIWTTEEFLAAA